MKWGVSYYPELVPEADWPRDLDRMRDTGLTVLRVLDFAWSAIEPREGVYTWDWLDRFVDLVDERGMELVVCTPTATPPAWLATQYPQVMAELASGQRRPFGSRRDPDLCSPIYRDYCREIARCLGERYGQHGCVIGWQIDNEIFGPEGPPPESHSPEANWRFRRWLREKYTTIDAVNDAWFTTFWNQRFSDWGEVSTPRHERVCRGWAIDHSRFFTDMIVEFAREQYDVLRPIIRDDQWISTNSTAMLDRGIDHAKLSRAMDVAAWDAYPGAASAGHGHEMAFAALVCDWLRAATGKPVKVLETSAREGRAGPSLFQMLHAHGCDLSLIWHWREHRGNVEQRSNAICDYTGEPDEGYLERIRAAIAATGDLPPPDVSPRKAAMLLSIDNYRHHLHRASFERSKLDYLHAVIAMYQPLFDAGVAMDVIEPGADLSGYDLVASPSLQLLDESDAVGIAAYVEAGGTLLASAKTAHLTTTAVFHLPPMSPLSDVLGVTIRRDHRSEAPLTMKMADGETFEALGWAEAWETTDGEVLAHFMGGDLDGRPAALQRTHGRGRVLYLAAPSAGAVAHLLPSITE